MSRIFVFIFASLVCAFAFAGNEMTAQESEWAKAAVPFSKDAVIDGVQLKLLVDVNPEKGISPAGSAYYAADDSCAFIVRVRDNMAVDVLRDLADTDHSWEVAKTVAFAHEYGHCVQFHVSHTQGDADTPKRSHTKDEAFADVFALAWVYQHQPENFEEAMDYLRKLRGLPKSLTANYNTQVYLRKAEGFPDMPNFAQYTPYAIAKFIVFGTPLSTPSTLAAN